jgi:hypothetical protein
MDRNAISRSKSSAVVIVHAVNAMADLSTVTVNARNGRASNGQPIPSQVLWTADDKSSTLGIQWVDPRQDCVRGTHCEGSECHAVTNVDSKGSRCEYKIVVNNTVGTDPVIIVESCCP